MPFPLFSCLSRRSLRTLTLAAAPLGALAVGLAGCPTTTDVTTYVPITGIVIRASSLVAGLGCGTGPGQVYRYVAVVRHADDPLAPVVSMDATVGDAPLVDATLSDATPADAPEIDATPTDATPADATPTDATPADATPTDATPADATPTDGTTDGAAPLATAADAAQPVAATVENDPAAGVWVNVFDCFTDGVFENLPASADGSLAFAVSIFAYDTASYDASMLPASLGCPPAAAGQFGGCGASAPIDVGGATWSTVCSAVQQSGTSVLAVCGPLQATGAGAGDDSSGDAGAGAADGATDAGPAGDAPQADGSILDGGAGSDGSTAGSDAGVSPGDAASPDAADDAGDAGAPDATPNDG